MSTSKAQLIIMTARNIACSKYDEQWDISPSFAHLLNKTNMPEINQYFYHPDHASTGLSTGLGSASFITDATGYAEQHIQYLPFGELFISQRNSTFDSRYKFTAKELDNETQYTYFGARYLDSEVSIWLSIDPLSDKYPSMSAYMYCAGNPVILVDPDGMSWDIVCPETNQTIEYKPNMIIPDGSSKFVSDAITGLNFLYNNPEGDVNRVEYISNSEIIVTISQQKQSGQSSKYNGVYKSLLWDNLNADIYEQGSQSPIIGLAHETDHAFLSVKGWEAVYLFESKRETNGEEYKNSVSAAYMYREDPQAPSWEKSAMSYENFIGGKTVDGKKLSTFMRTEYTPPQKQTNVKSIFDIE